MTGDFLLFPNNVSMLDAPLDLNLLVGYTFGNASFGTFVSTGGSFLRSNILATEFLTVGFTGNFTAGSSVTAARTLKLD